MKHLTNIGAYLVVIGSVYGYFKGLMAFDSLVVAMLLAVIVVILNEISEKVKSE